MSFWNFLCEVAVFNMICNLFSPKRKRITSTFSPSRRSIYNEQNFQRIEELNCDIEKAEKRVAEYRKLRGASIAPDEAVDDIDDLQDRNDELEDRLSECDMMSDRYDRIQDEIDLLQDRRDELEDNELMLEDMHDEFDSLSHHSHGVLYDMYHDEDYDW